MKNAVWLVIGLLLLWNIFLSISLNDVQNEQVSEDNKTVYVENTVNGYVTDITKVVANTDSQVVTVKAMVNENEYIASGFVYKFVDDSAYIVTNNHVVNNIENIMVRFDNGIEVNAEIFGFDKYYDIAILKVDVDFEVDSVKLGSSSVLNKGEFIIAIGSPISDEFEGSVSVGIVSGLNRLLPIDVDSDGVDDFEVLGIQTDAVLNAGNSGGPLINMAGEVIGINTVSLKSYANGLNFSIAIDEVKAILDNIMNQQSIYHPVISFNGKDISEFSNYQKSFYGIQLDQLAGIYVASVEQDSSYFDVGLQNGDIIINLDEVQINNTIDLRTTLFNYQQGATVNFGVIRNNESITLTMVLE
jgi:serine protease Do